MVSAGVPYYELAIREDDGRLTRSEHMDTTIPEVWFDVGHEFEHDGRLLRVALVEEAEQPFLQRLVCRPA